MYLIMCIFSIEFQISPDSLEPKEYINLKIEYKSSSKYFYFFLLKIKAIYFLGLDLAYASAANAYSESCK